ncbi:hypothetical protein P154DRAFT_529214 [Amniculicola lignicola CBS 123094]|uniref:Uncharacterized protein n=1 Tax=Amniculicola lignicola CBS 123094 TaxID=1392246 RepID=A0A6A5WY99_9PLEO|nr:hypothetical protein P154DRAFT_529214 [Amniculicola lignicola CBS 123094]
MTDRPTFLGPFTAQGSQSFVSRIRAMGQPILSHPIIKSGRILATSNHQLLITALGIFIFLTAVETLAMVNHRIALKFCLYIIANHFDSIALASAPILMVRVRKTATLSSYTQAGCIHWIACYSFLIGMGHWYDQSPVRPALCILCLFSLFQINESFSGPLTLRVLIYTAYSGVTFWQYSSTAGSNYILNSRTYLWVAVLFWFASNVYMSGKPANVSHHIQQVGMAQLTSNHSRDPPTAGGVLMVSASRDALASGRLFSEHVHQSHGAAIVESHRAQITR